MEPRTFASLPRLIATIETRPVGKGSLDHHFLRTPNPDVFFIFVEKIACTAVKQTLFSAFYGNLHALNPEDFFKGWQHHDLLHAFSGEVFQVNGRHVLGWDRSQLITFCRNPYTRFLSAFANRVADPRDPDVDTAQYFKRETLFNGARNGHFKGAIEEFAGGVTLFQFARYVREAPVESYDVHWTPQHLLNLVDLVPPACIVRFENFESEFRSAWESYVQTPFPDMPKQERNPSPKTKYVFDQATADLVYDVYAKDFEVFGYDRDSWKSLK